MAKRESKESRKRRITRILLIVVIVVAVLAILVGILRKQVSGKVNEDSSDEVQTATVSKGSISTTVSGTGNLNDENTEDLILHSDVEIDEILVSAGDKVEEGDLLATVHMSTVLSAMSDIQSQLNDLDDEIGEASEGELDSTIKASVDGRIKKVYGSKGDDVSSIMYEHGALALLSLDGYMAVEIATDSLSQGDTVTVTGSDGTTFDGTVESTSSGKAIVLISDKTSVYDDTVTVTNSEGTEVGSGTLYIHEMMKITGIAGTISSVNISENDKISSGKTLFNLTDTSFSANYTSLLKEREELEEQLQQLILIYQDGAVLAKTAGVIASVDGDTSSADSAQSMNGGYTTGQTGTSGSGTEYTLLSISSGGKMSVTISVDETDILSLEEGQKATISVEALGDESAEGTVSEIDTTATSSNGVTQYTVTVTCDKTENMLSGMTADVAIVIEGVEDALLIPSDALTQTSATSYVYTSYNEETGELGDMVEVTAGMNNGQYVEITSGLEEGATVYYFESEESGFNFGSFGGGSMPGGNFGGGNMPGGNGGSGGFSGGMPGGNGGSGGGMPGGR